MREGNECRLPAQGAFRGDRDVHKVDLGAFILNDRFVRTPALSVTQTNWLVWATFQPTSSNPHPALLADIERRRRPAHDAADHLAALTFQNRPPWNKRELL